VSVTVSQLGNVPYIYKFWQFLPAVCEVHNKWRRNGDTAYLTSSVYFISETMLWIPTEFNIRAYYVNIILVHFGSV